MNPTITVITATYNSSRTLAWTIQSVLAQDFTDFEYLIIGDACTDNTTEVVAEFADPRVRFINLSSNSGSQATPNNHGLELARGEWIAYVGHDDLWFPWHLSSLLATAKQHNTALVYAMSANFSPQGLELIYGVVDSSRQKRNFLVPPSSWLHQRNQQRWRNPERLIVGVDNDFLIHWIKSNQPIAQSKRLSVLKYPSLWWHLYQRTNNFPQEMMLQKLRMDANLLEYQVLNEAAKLASKLYSRSLTFSQWLKQGLKPLAMEFLMLSSDFFVFRWYFQYLRKISSDKTGFTTNTLKPLAPL